MIPWPGFRHSCLRVISLRTEVHSILKLPIWTRAVLRWRPQCLNQNHFCFQDRWSSLYSRTLTSLCLCSLHLKWCCSRPLNNCQACSSSLLTLSDFFSVCCWWIIACTLWNSPFLAALNIWGPHDAKRSFARALPQQLPKATVWTVTKNTASLLFTHIDVMSMIHGHCINTQWTPWKHVCLRKKDENYQYLKVEFLQ